MADTLTVTLSKETWNWLYRSAENAKLSTETESRRRLHADTIARLKERVVKNGRMFSELETALAAAIDEDERTDGS
jgi:hypothetical protein